MSIPHYSSYASYVNPGGDSRPSDTISQPLSSVTATQWLMSKFSEASSLQFNYGDPCELHVTNHSSTPVTLQIDYEWSEPLGIHIIASGTTEVIMTSIGTTHTIYFNNSVTPGATVRPICIPNVWRTNNIFTAEIGIPMNDIMTCTRSVKKDQVISTRTRKVNMEQYRSVDYHIKIPPNKLNVIVTNHSELHSTLVSNSHEDEEIHHIRPYSTERFLITEGSTMSNYIGIEGCDEDYNINRWTLEKGQLFFPNTKEWFTKGLLTQCRDSSMNNYIYVDILKQLTRAPTHPESGWGELILNEDNNYGTIIAPYQIFDKHKDSHRPTRPIDRLVIVDQM